MNAIQWQMKSLHQIGLFRLHLFSFLFRLLLSLKKCGHKIKTSIKKKSFIIVSSVDVGWLVGWVDSLIFSACMLFSCTAQLNCVEVFMVKSPWTQLLYKLTSLLQVVRVVENKLTKKTWKISMMPFWTQYIKWRRKKNATYKKFYISVDMLFHRLVLSF